MVPTLRRSMVLTAAAALSGGLVSPLSAQPVIQRPAPALSAPAGGRTPDNAFRVNVTSGSPGPGNHGIELTVDLRAAGGSRRAPFVDRGLVCDDDTTDGSYVACFALPFNAVPGTYTVTLTAEDPEGRTDAVPTTMTVGAPADADGDGLPDRWETEFGFDPAASGEAGLDPDGDGVSNLNEMRAGTHPRGTATRYFAEGVSNSFFRTQLDVFNPHATASTVVVRMQASDGAQTSWPFPLQAFGSVQLNLHNLSPGDDYAIVVESSQVVAVDRTVDWVRDRHPETADPFFWLGYGSHAETGITGTSTTWYLAEGATHGGFDLFYLLDNPGAAPASVTVEYLRPAPLPSIVKTYAVAPHARRTIYVDAEGPELAATDVSATFTSTVPIVVERAMYYSTPTQTFAAGHDGAAAPALSTTWYLAEGATGYFDTFLLLANPGATDATVTVSYGTAGPPIVRAYPVPARSRLTVNAAQDLPFGTAFSTAITSTAPILVERAMWWPSPLMHEGPWREAHLVGGATAAATRWAVANLHSYVNGYGFTVLDEVQSYLLIGNPTSTATTVTISDGTHATTLSLAAQGRLTVAGSYLAAAFTGNPTAGLFTSGVTVESAGPAIVVERATYQDRDGVRWVTGTAVAGTPLP